MINLNAVFKMLRHLDNNRNLKGRCIEVSVACGWVECACGVSIANVPVKGRDSVLVGAGSCVGDV